MLYQKRSIRGRTSVVSVTHPATSRGSPETPSWLWSPDLYTPEGFWDNGLHEGRLHPHVQEGSEPRAAKAGTSGRGLREDLRGADIFAKGRPPQAKGGAVVLPGGGRAGGVEARPLRQVAQGVDRVGGWPEGAGVEFVSLRESIDTTSPEAIS